MEQDKKLNLQVFYPPYPERPTAWQKLKLKWHYATQVSPEVPSTIEYFKSEVAVLNEKRRHYQEYPYTIHPLSKFNYRYQVYCFFLYTILIFFKLFDFGFLHITRTGFFRRYYATLLGGLMLDLISLLNMSLQFLIGFCNPRTRTVELSLRLITKRYLSSGHFICDLLSSVPKYFFVEAGVWIQLVIVAFALLKIRRLTTVIELIKPTAIFLGIKSTTKSFLCGFFLILFMAKNFIACLHAGLPQYRNALTKSSDASNFFSNFTFYQQYLITLFKCASYSYMVQIDYVLHEQRSYEEIVLSVINYFIGKLLVLSLWIVLLFNFITNRILRGKFEEIMTELNEYMNAKHLPRHLRRRLITYYKYKYQNIFFNEALVRAVLSENLKREMDVFLCKSLIQHVTIFRHVSPRLVKQVTTYLQPEIFLPNDMIIQSGMPGDCMYFIESGTVAVFTPSGKELCHLQDGAYFGEISVVLKETKRSASIIAVEITRVYTLKKKHFYECFKRDDIIYRIIIDEAERRLQGAKGAEETHKSTFATK